MQFNVVPRTFHERESIVVDTTRSGSLMDAICSEADVDAAPNAEIEHGWQRHGGFKKKIAQNHCVEGYA